MKHHNKKNHLPLFGVGPFIVFGQIGFTVITIIISKVLEWDTVSFGLFKTPFIILGYALIITGICFDVSAKYNSKLFKHVEENKLITTGIYGIVRNPVYSGAFLGCLGAVLITNNILLIFVPFICWIYMTVFLILTEEKWLKDLYGQEYIDYYKKVNRCIPWFSKK